MCTLGIKIHPRNSWIRIIVYPIITPLLFKKISLQIQKKLSFLQTPLYRYTIYSLCKEWKYKFIWVQTTSIHILVSFATTTEYGIIHQHIVGYSCNKMESYTNIQYPWFRMQQGISMFSPWRLGQIWHLMTILESACHEDSETPPTC